MKALRGVPAGSGAASSAHRAGIAVVAGVRLSVWLLDRDSAGWQPRSDPHAPRPCPSAHLE
jgi:hypothetical protein